MAKLEKRGINETRFMNFSKHKIRLMSSLYYKLSKTELLCFLNKMDENFHLNFWRVKHSTHDSWSNFNEIKFYHVDRKSVNEVRGPPGQTGGLSIQYIRLG